MNSPCINPSAARRARQPVVAAVLAFAAMACGAQAREPVVGQVSLLIGQARVVRKDGQVEALQQGASVAVGDRLETSANGHVHVRFVDNAAVSVRPESILEVQAYRYDAARPQASEVRLRLEQGTGRSISGAATEVDKSRFRLNTPIAAIGVRGTDFLVQTDRRGVRAAVADGAIVFGALGAGCSAQSLGPCSGPNARLLAADMGDLMVELHTGEQFAQVVPASGTLLASAGSGARARFAASYAAEAGARAAGLLAAEPSATGQRPRNDDLAAAGVLTAAAAAVPDLNRRGDPQAQLVWGRWTFTSSPHDEVSSPFAVASLGRHITVADSRAGLFRADDPTNPDKVFEGPDATVSFRLTRGAASYEAGGRSEAASIDAGTLTLDFARRSFATYLGLSSASGGRAELSVVGDVRKDGTFAYRDEAQHVAGAFSLDGKEAGYLFERTVSGGVFRGRTLWGH